MERGGWLNGDVSFISLLLFKAPDNFSSVWCFMQCGAYKYCLSDPLIAPKLLLRFSIYKAKLFFLFKKKASRFSLKVLFIFQVR